MACFHENDLYIGPCEYIGHKEYDKKILISRCCMLKNQIYKAFDEDEINNIDFVQEALNIVENNVQPINFEETCLIRQHTYCPLPEKLNGLQLSFYAACNAKCEFCYVNQDYNDNKNNHNNKNKEAYLNALYNAKGKVKKLKLTDRGEPLILQKEMKEFFKSLKPGDFEEIYFATNGILLDEEFIQIMKDAQTKFIITVSINAPNRELYKKIVGVDAFDKVIENIKCLKLLDNTELTLTAVYYEPLFGKLDTFKEELSKYLGKDFFGPDDYILIRPRDFNKKYLENKEYKEKI